jgi:prepilin-type N-terminal cleavage/methylation domain-containing protein
MLNKLKKPNQKGFTIIEVMIVLAIAGLILLIVFLAIPALQRNSRNTQRKNDVAALLAAVAEFSNNNNGALPNTCGGTNPVTFNTVAAGATTSQTRMGYYNQAVCSVGVPTAGGRVGILAAYAATGPASTTVSQDWVTLVPAATCSTTTPGQTAAGSSRSWAAVYQIESGAGTYGALCQDS